MNELQHEEIKHFDRMIEWAEKQKPDKKPDQFKMLDEIGERWSSFNSVYCMVNQARFDNKLERLICDCALFSMNGCCNGLWDRMDMAETWADWITYAKLQVEYIKKHG